MKVAGIPRCGVPVGEAPGAAAGRHDHNVIAVDRIHADSTGKFGPSSKDRLFSTLYPQPSGRFTRTRHRYRR